MSENSKGPPEPEPEPAGTRARSYLDILLAKIYRLPQIVQIVLVVGLLILLGMMVTNHTAMMDVINLILLLKGLSAESHH